MKVAYLLFLQHTEWHDLIKEKDQYKEDRKNRGRIEIEIQYTCIHVLAQDTHEVHGTYFKATRGNRMILYQDAHTPQLSQVEFYISFDLSTKSAKLKFPVQWADSARWHTLQGHHCLERPLQGIASSREVHLHHWMECLHWNRPCAG